MDFYANGYLSSHISKPMAEVPLLQRQQWVLQVRHLASTPTSSLPTTSLPSHTHAHTQSIPVSTDTRHLRPQVAQGMKFLHSREHAVVHRDLKPQNVLLNEHMVAKIAGFGYSRKADSGIASTSPLAPGLDGAHESLGLMEVVREAVVECGRIDPWMRLCTLSLLTHAPHRHTPSTQHSVCSALSPHRPHPPQTQRGTSPQKPCAAPVAGRSPWTMCTGNGRTCTLSQC